MGGGHNTEADREVRERERQRKKKTDSHTQRNKTFEATNMTNFIDS